MVADDFLAADDDLLIQEVSKCPEIYNPMHEGYKKVHLKDKQWSEICLKLNKSVDQCKRRWKNHRDNYFKQKKSKTKTGKSRRRNPILDKLRFLENVEPKTKLNRTLKLRSLCDTQADDLILEIDSASNHTQTRMDMDDETSFEPMIQQVQGNNENVESMPGSSVNESLKPAVATALLLELLKRRDQENSQLLSQLLNLQNQRKSEDELDLFFKCISRTIRKFPPQAVCEMKNKIFSLVSEQEMKMLQGSARPDSSMSTNSGDDKSLDKDDKKFPFASNKHFN